MSAVPSEARREYQGLELQTTVSVDDVFKEEPLTANLSLQHHLPTPSTHQVSNFLKSHTTFRNSFRKAEKHTSVGAVSKKSVTKDSEFKANLYNTTRPLVSKRIAKKKKGKALFSNVIQFKNQLHNRYACLDSQLPYRMGMHRKARINKNCFSDKLRNVSDLIYRG